ncbi:MAG TPA: PAS domain S-box protein [Terriglobales bacterium]|nr:PAS domain S-box protein [Terriglobales bacterium]
MSPGRIALGYAALAILWIAFSDAIVTYFKLHPFVMTIKGSVFVLVTASLLYFTIRRLVRAVQRSSQERDETAELYRTVVEASNEGICLLDESGRISFLNGHLAAMLGRPAAELEGKRLQDFIEEPNVLAAPAAQQSETRECRLRKDPDSKPWVLISRHPVLNDAGEVVRAVVTIADISERKRVEKALHRSDAYLPTVPSAKPTLTEQGATGLLRYGLAILSVGVALALALLLQYFHFRDAAIPLLLFAVAISSWYGRLGPAVLAAILSTIGFYWYFIEPVRTIYIYWSDVPYFIIFVAFATLISWFASIRRRVEAGLHEQAALLNLTHDAVLVMDMEGVIRYWNRGAEERYGWPAEKAVGKVVHDLLKTVFPSPLEEIKAEVTRTGRWEGELLHTTKHGTQLVLTSRWSLQRDRHGVPVAILEINNDISERKRAEEALSRLNRELRAISYCNQALLRATDEQSLLDEICRIVCEAAGYRMAWVAYAEHNEAKSVRPAACTGIEEAYLSNLGITWGETERSCGPTGTTIRTGKTCCIQEFATDPGLAPWRESGLLRDFRSAIALPLKDEHTNTFGCLSIYAAQPNAFTSEEVRLLEELAGDMAFGIVTLRSRAARKQAEEALRKSEAYLAEAQRLSHTGSWALDMASGNYVYYSEEYIRISGFDPKQGIPAKDQALQQIHPDDVAKFSQVYQKLIDEKVDSEAEYRIVLPDGTVKYVHAISHPVLNANGELVEVVGTTMDVTERKRAEEALRRSEAYLSEAQKLTHTGAWATDAAPKPLYWSEELFRLYGLDPRGGLPTHDQTIQRVHPEDREKYAQAFYRVIRQKVDADVEFRTVLPDGAIRCLYGLGHPVLNASGDLVEVVGTTVDITERKRAEEALRESETRFRTFVDHAGDALFVQDLEQGTIVDVNRSACESLGYTRQELIGNKPLAFHLDSYQAEMILVAQRVVAGETAFDRHWHRRKDGTTFPVEAHTSLVSYGGRRFLLKVARDISDRVRAEEQRDKLRQLETELAHLDRLTMLGELTASIAHEVNQPLSGVVSNASAGLRWLAGDTPNLEEAQEGLRRIVRDGKRAGEVIARIRALTKKAPTPREKLDLNETLRQVLALIGDQAKWNSVTIRTRFADDLFPISGDQVQLQQVALNLAMNAIDAMSNVSERARELVITTRNIDTDQVQVTVEDSGVGLDPNTIKKIFEPFYTTKPTGMGMGLSISRSILQSHGGRLWATAKDGPGMIFCFALPKYQEEKSYAGVLAV